MNERTSASTEASERDIEGAESVVVDIFDSDSTVGDDAGEKTATYRSTSQRVCEKPRIGSRSSGRETLLQPIHQLEVPTLQMQIAKTVLPLVQNIPRLHQVCLDQAVIHLRWECVLRLGHIQKVPATNSGISCEVRSSLVTGRNAQRSRKQPSSLQRDTMGEDHVNEH